MTVRVSPPLAYARARVREGALPGDAVREACDAWELEGSERFQFIEQAEAELCCGTGCCDTEEAE